MHLDGRPIQDSLRSLTDAKSKLKEIHDWIMIHVYGNDVLPREIPREVAENLNAVFRSISVAEKTLQTMADANTEFLVKVLRKKQTGSLLSKAEYYRLRTEDLILGIDEEDSEYQRYLHNSTKK